MRLAEFQIKAASEKAGFWTLCATLFLLSFPRSWSLYPLGTMLFTGLVIWVIDFGNIFRRFVKIWYLVIPSVIYFIIHLISVLSQADRLSVLEDRLMFLLVPLLGFPVFTSKYAGDKITALFSGYILGIIGISIFLMIRVTWMICSDFPGGIAFFTWLNQDKVSYFSIGFSVLEHPTYLALKINWALILLLFFSRLTSFKPGYIFVIALLLSGTLLFVASKAGLIIWFIVILVFLITNIKKGIRNKILYTGVIAAFILAAVPLSMRIQRISDYLSTTKSRIASENLEWKNLDQRTREWYSAIQVIREKPVFGTGLSKAEDRLVEEYVKNGFNEEAALRMNAHNQFLQAQMTFGIAGTLSLFLMLLTPLFLGKKLEFPHLAAAFVVMISFFLVFESMFNRQWGIMFFILFYFIITTGAEINNAVPYNGIANS
jgi:O-antigen ligase